MKKIGALIIFLAILFQVSGQEPVKEQQETKQVAVVPDSNENTRVIIGDNLVNVEDTKEAFKVRIGNRGLNILESLEGPKFAFEKFERAGNSAVNDDEEKEENHNHRRNHFSGHWAGMEIGFNNYLVNNSISMPADISYMNLHSSKSVNFNINFAQLSFGITRHFGVVTGLGLNWNNYRFDGNLNIQERSNGIIDSLSPLATLKKSKLATIYMNLPVMLEMQIPLDNHRINVAAGFIGAIKLGSHTKMVFEGGDDVKSYGDFNLNLLRYGATARVGYRNVQIYGTYYATPLFEKGKGPGAYDLNPFEIGFSFSIFN